MFSAKSISVDISPIIFDWNIYISDYENGNYICFNEVFSFIYNNCTQIQIKSNFTQTNTRVLKVTLRNKIQIQCQESYI